MTERLKVFKIRDKAGHPRPRWGKTQSDREQVGLRQGVRERAQAVRARSKIVSKPVEVEADEQE